jgi:hypothetical protein
MSAGSMVGSRVGSQVGSAVNTDTDDAAFLASLNGAYIGDSNQTGIGAASAADTGFLLLVARPKVGYNTHYAVAVGPPPVFTDFPGNFNMGPLQPYANPSLSSMGVEMTAGADMLAFTAAPSIAKNPVTGSTLAVEWNPTGTYPAAGAGNLFNLWVARQLQWVTLTGRQTDYVVVSLGTNDAANAGQAAAFQANMTAFTAAIRSALGAGLKIVWIRTNPNTVAANLATVRAAQDAYVAGDANCLLVDNDDLTLKGDGLHYTEASYITLGQRCTEAARRLLGFTARAVPTSPAVVGYGSEIHGTGNLVVPSWGGEIDGDLQVMDVCCGIVAGTITTPAGWTLVADSGDSTAVGVHEHRSVFTRPVTAAAITANLGHMPATTITIATSTRNAAKVYTVRGPNLNPTVEASSVFVSNAINTSFSGITGVTTVSSNDLVMMLGGGYCGSDGTSDFTNAGLTGVTKVQDSSANINTDRQNLNCTTGLKAAAGATGTWSATTSANMILACVTIAIKP